MRRWDLINWFISRFEYKTYLEIGIDGGRCFDQIKCENKYSVDPVKGKSSKYHFLMTSDKFFKKNKTKFDIVLVDGLHECDQVLRDVDNAAEHLNENGTIVVHDTNPTHESMAGPKWVRGGWFGDSWKAICKLRHLSKYKIRTHMQDCGCTIIRFGKEEKVTELYDTYKDFNDHRSEVLKPITEEEIKHVY